MAEFHRGNHSSPSVAAANAAIAAFVTPQAPADINNEMIGKIFDDATTRLVGGVDASNAAAIIADLKTVQADMVAISAGDGEGTLTELHYDVMEAQLSQEITAVNQALNGTNPFAAKTINDIHRDILDIFLGDPNLVAEKGASWTPLPQVTTPPTPFADNAKQTTFVSNFITDSNTLADRALAGETGDQIINDLQHFIAQSEKFVMANGQTSTIFNARFENEIGKLGTSGTAAASLIEGIQNHDMGEIAAAANQLITNASDFAGNNQQANGDTYDAVVAAATGSTAAFIDLKGGGDNHGHDGHHDNHSSPSVAAANAAIAAFVTPQAPADINNEMIGKIFDDATTRLVGGVDASNAAAIIADLKTVQADMVAISAGDGEGTLTELHYDVMEAQLSQEITAVNQALNGTNPFAAKTINDIHRDILDIFLGDPNLVAEKGASWTPLPQVTTPPTPFADNAKQTTFVSNFITDSNTLADRALAGETGDQIINDLQHFIAQSEKFVMANGQTSTIFNARFENEIGKLGTSGTAAASLIEGIQNHDMGEIAAAANQLITNASDFAGNNQQANGDTYDAVVAAATGSTAAFIDLKGGGDNHGHHDNVETAGADVAHSSPTFEHLWHHA